MSEVPEAEDDRSRMGFLEHLDELRRRIIYSLWAILASGLLAFWFISDLNVYMLQYFSVKLDLANLANSKVEINTKSFLGVSNGQDPHREHPRFNAQTNNGMTAFQNFYTKTMEGVTAGTCGPSKLTN